MRIAELERAVGRFVQGEFRCKPCPKATVGGGGAAIELRDATGSCVARGPLALLEPLMHEMPEIVRVHGFVRQDEAGALCLNVAGCRRISAPIVPSWYLLPRCLVPKGALGAFDRLCALLERVELPALRAFLDEVFLDMEVAEHFLVVAGSRNHHHARAGGLLEHSVECAEAAWLLADRFLPEAECELAVVGALLHDIGKVRTRRTGVASIPLPGVSHEALNLEVLARHLPVLDAAWPGGGASFREMLAPSRVPGGNAPLLGTDLVRYVDRLSAGADLRRQSFIQLPAVQQCTRTSHGQLLARTSPLPKAVPSKSRHCFIPELI